MVDPICMKPVQSFSFQTKTSIIVNKYIFFKIYIHNTIVVKFHEKRWYNFDLLVFDYNIVKKKFIVFMWFQVIHMFITFQLNILIICLNHSSKPTP